VQRRAERVQHAVEPTVWHMREIAQLALAVEEAGPFKLPRQVLGRAVASNRPRNEECGATEYRAEPQSWLLRSSPGD
jgi:hypothetical protein